MGDAETWTVVTWNIQGRARPRVAALARVLRELDADLIALQEARWWQTQHLALRLRMSRIWNRKHYPYTRLLVCLAEGAAILTPHQLSDGDAQVVSDTDDTSTYRRRIAQWATVTTSSGRPVRVVNLHLSPGEFAEERRREAARVSELIERFDTDTLTVVAGDLNDDRDPTVIDALPGEEHERPPPTNPSDRPSQVLDHVLLPHDCEHVSTTVPAGGERWAALSDHLPVTVRFRAPRATRG